MNDFLTKFTPENLRSHHCVVVNVLSDIINQDGNPKYKYYYMNAETIVKSMKKALQRTKKSEKMSTDEL